MSGPAAGPAAKKPKSKLPTIAIAAVVVIGAGAGGFMYRRSTAVKKDPVATPAAPPVNSVLALDSFVVNLQDASGNGYLRVTISLGLGGPTKDDDKDKETTSLPRVRDTILGVLGSRSVDELLTPDGKTKLKADLLDAIDKSVPELDCKEIYFTEFLVQH